MLPPSSPRRSEEVGASSEVTAVVDDLHLAEIRAEEAAVDEIEQSRDRLRSAGRRAIGVTGIGKIASLRETLAGSGVGMYPAIALGALVAVDQLQTSVMTIMGPEITGALGIPRSTFAAAVLVKTLVVTLAMLPIAAVVQRKARRAAVCVATAYAWSVLTGMTAFVVSVWGLVLVSALAGAATASVQAVHQPLLVDTYPPSARMRVLSFYRGANSVGDVLGPLLVGLCTALLDLTWRGAFLGVAVASIAAAFLASRLRDPGFGKWDTEQVRKIVRADAGTPDLAPGEASLGFFEIARRLMLIPTIRRILAAHAVLGMFLAPFLTYLSFYLQERWGLGPGVRAVFFAAMPLFSIPALTYFSRRGEDMFRADPARLLRTSAVLMAVGLTAISLALFAPVFALVVLLFGAAFAVLAVLAPAMSLPMFAIVPSHMRPHVAALSGIALAGVGGTAGLLLLSGVDRRFGAAGAILSLALPGFAAGLVLRTAARTVQTDLNRMVDEIIEEEEVRSLAARGIRLPMLACRHIDFAYGQLQVLFDVNFTVDDGEIVALLGTNGAGKSTLLRVVSGLGLPSRGSVRYRGLDVTFLDAERRVGLGIGQVPGGRAVFGPMTVAENLRTMGYSHGRNRRALEVGIESSFEAFPRLADRRDQLASTLSGGEQQMLGLASAFIVRPRLLLIDELSLGLAPKVVGELLTMVRRINQAGTAVVIVEQSVNVALSVVEHAYFMEKGEIRFDGSSAGLLAHPDLLRSVFLEGASNRLGGSDGNGSTR
jgi:ABC-type branched-subunit amino acid transport system ATPase component/MFS family permease